MNVLLRRYSDGPAQRNSRTGLERLSLLLLVPFLFVSQGVGLRVVDIPLATFYEGGGDWSAAVAASQGRSSKKVLRLSVDLPTEAGVIGAQRLSSQEIDSSVRSYRRLVYRCLSRDHVEKSLDKIRSRFKVSGRVKESKFEDFRRLLFKCLHSSGEGEPNIEYRISRLK